VRRAAANSRDQRTDMGMAERKSAPRDSTTRALEKSYAGSSARSQTNSVAS
jgi:hypothetical protein